MNQYQEFIATSRYSRWREEDNRRETWEETVDRYVDYMLLKQPTLTSISPEIKDAILNLEVMPSMRLLMTAGAAVNRCNVAAFNCAYVPVDSPRTFDETFYILMCGTGVGFSVENKYVSQLPRINEHFETSSTVLVVQDSKSGWARALRELISLLYVGQIPRWDLSLLRPRGARLKTFGGRSSGPEPLNDLFQFCVDVFRKASGRQLTSLECHDLMCKIGEVVVVGGVRRSALISLSDLADSRLRDAKTGKWWEQASHRALANNSAVYESKPELAEFMNEFSALIASGSGERGIFSREASRNQAASSGRRSTADIDFGTNPCSEIILRPFQFCNLTEVVVRAGDTFEDLAQKVKIATILGTYQSSLTNFKYLRKVWRQTTEEEALLGVSLTGILDNPDILEGDTLKRLKQVAIEVNREYAGRLGVNISAAITCVKPSGTVSQLVDSASGIHPRYSEFYIRTVRGDKKDPLSRFLVAQGVSAEPDIMRPNDTWVFSFPQRAPKGAITRDKLGAIQHLEIWKKVQEDWCEHKPSITVNVKEDEWLDVASWVWKNFDVVSGIAFLPYSDHTYEQAPYQELPNEETYEHICKYFPTINWGDLVNYETEDTSTGAQELACTGGVCEIVDITQQA